MSDKYIRITQTEVIHSIYRTKWIWVKGSLHVTVLFWMRKANAKDVKYLENKSLEDACWY